MFSISVEENVFQSPDNIEVSGEFKTEPSVGGRISDKNSNLFCKFNTHTNKKIVFFLSYHPIKIFFHCRSRKFDILLQPMQQNFETFRKKS